MSSVVCDVISSKLVILSTTDLVRVRAFFVFVANFVVVATVVDVFVVFTIVDVVVFVEVVSWVDSEVFVKGIFVSC